MKTKADYRPYVLCTVARNTDGSPSVKTEVLAWKDLPWYVQMNIPGKSPVDAGGVAITRKWKTPKEKVFQSRDELLVYADARYPEPVLNDLLRHEFGHWVNGDPDKEKTSIMDEVKADAYMGATATRTFLWLKRKVGEKNLPYNKEEPLVWELTKRSALWCRRRGKAPGSFPEAIESSISDALSMAASRA